MSAAFAFTEALARRAPSVVVPLSDAAPAARIAPAVARRHFLDPCPFLRLAGLAANQVVLEAMESEKTVHVVDLGGTDTTQWLKLLHLLATCPEGSPYFRLTAVHEHKDLLPRPGAAHRSCLEALNYYAVLFNCLEVDAMAASATSGGRRRWRASGLAASRSATTCCCRM